MSIAPISQSSINAAANNHDVVSQTSLSKNSSISKSEASNSLSQTLALEEAVNAIPEANSNRVEVSRAQNFNLHPNNKV